MKFSYRIISLIILVILGYKSIQNELDGYESSFFSIFQFTSFFLLLLITVTALIFDTSYYQTDKKIIKFSSAFLGIILCSIVTTMIIQRTQTDNSNTILKLSNMAKANNVIRFEFKENMKFRFIESNMLGQNIYYGTYLRSNDSLQITSIRYSGNIKELPKYGVIRNDTVFWNKFDTMLINKMP